MEVEARIRFLTPSLGNCRSKELDRMLRDAEGNVIFLQTWWRASLGYAAQALNRRQTDVNQIQADPVLAGEVKRYTRHYSPTESKEHEAFLAGDEVLARFCLPPQVTLEDFRELLSTAGRYAGVSPYGYKHDYGRFTVLSVEALRGRKRESGDDPQVRPADPGGPGLQGAAGR